MIAELPTWKFLDQPRRILGRCHKLDDSLSGDGEIIASYQSHAVHPP